MYRETHVYNTPVSHQRYHLGLYGKAQKFAIECGLQIQEDESAGHFGSLFDVNYRANLWLAEVRQRALSVRDSSLVDIFFLLPWRCHARLTYSKQARSRKSRSLLGEQYPISVVASTERTVITPKKHNLLPFIYSGWKMMSPPRGTLQQYRRRMIVGSGDAYVSGASMATKT